MTIIFLSRHQNKTERGVENYVSELAERLTKTHSVKVLTSCRELFGQRADIIYPLNGGLQTLFCRIYSWIVGAKLIAGGHAGIGRDDRWNLYMFPDLFIAFSQKGYNWAKKTNPFIKIVKVSHGIDLKRFNPQVKSANIDLEKPIFITVSHLEPYKRVDLTIKAAAKLKKGSLLVLGKGPKEKEIDELGNRLLGKRYHRLVVSHDQVASYLTASHVFTLVSESSEAFGLVYLEALACNCPIVATDDSLRREIIGDAGLYIANPENSTAYARTLEMAGEKHWGGAPRKQAAIFDWDVITLRYERAFQSL